MNLVKVGIETLNVAKYNPRKDLQPSDSEYIKLKNSIEHFGYVEPIIVNKRNSVIVGGHQRLKILKDLGYKDVDVVYVDLSDKDEKALNVALNKISGDWDPEKLEDLLREISLDEDYDISLTGFDDVELDTLFSGAVDDLDNTEKDMTNRVVDKYSMKSNIPQYNPTGKKVQLADCVNIDKSKKLIDKINNSKVTDAEKDFLVKAAYRHNVFNYTNIAEYYCNASKEMQELMEDSALVIIDINDAIAKGYVKIDKRFKELTSDDLEDYEEVKL